MLRVRKATVMRLGWFILFSAVLFTCGDETERTFTISISPSLAALQYDGTESVDLSVQVYDDTGQPADSGDQVFVDARDAIGGQPTGRLGSDGTSSETLFLNSSGAASTTFSCNLTGDQATSVINGGVIWVALIFQHENGQRGTASIQCMLVYPGDWRIVSVLADRREIFPETGQADVTVTAHQPKDTNGDGVPDLWEPVPAGTQLRFATSGPCGFGTGGAAEERVTGTSGLGTATVTVVARSTEGTCTVTVAFDEANRCIEPEDTSETNYCQGMALISVDRDAREEGLLLVAVPESVPADGTSTISITASVAEAGGVPLTSVAVDFTTTGGTLISGDNSGSALSVPTDFSGQVTVTLQASLTPGAVEVRAEAGHGASELSDTLDISFVDVGSVSVVGDIAPTLGVRDSGRDPTARVCFEINDTDDEPFPDGYDVAFTAIDVSSEQAYVDPVTEQTEDGRACTDVYAGTTAGSITVKACATVGDSTRCGNSWSIGVVGGRPYRGGMTLSCFPVNIGALRWRDAGASDITSPPSGNLCTECSVQLSDQNGNPVGVFDDIQVTFDAESGRFPSGQAAVPDSTGHASVTWCADGPMPVDVDPVPGEPSWEEKLTHTIRNPRDGLVTIIAYVNGEEEFTDRNGNGEWDRAAGEVSEHFWDQPEPFVDANDNNEFDPEIDTDFFDVDGRTPNVWDPGNCIWDGGGNTTSIWVQTRVLLTGPPEFDAPDFFDGTFSNPPSELQLDSEYPILAQRLSHWFEQGQGNIYEVLNPVDDCEFDDPSFGEQNYCFELPLSGSITLFFNARDMFGNPMNESVGDIVSEFSPADCNSSFSVTSLSMSPPADQLPFTYSTVSQEPGGFVEECRAASVDEDRVNGYVSRITNWPEISGSYQRFTINYNGNLTSNCQMRMIYDTYRSCNSCGDPTLDLRGDWPYFIMVPQ